MARIVARNTGVLADGRDLSGRSNNATLTLSAEAPETTSFSEVNRSRVGGGISDVELSVDAFYDESASSIDEYLGSLKVVGASGLWGFYPVGLTACNRGRDFGGILTEYTMNAAVADAMGCSFTVTGGSVTLDTKILSTGSLEGTGASAAANGVDYGGSAPGQVTAIARYLVGAGADDTIAASLQDSTNDSAWVTLVEFANLTTGNTTSLVTSTSAARYRRYKYLVTNGSAGMVVTCGSNMMV